MFLVINPHHLSSLRLPVTAETHDAREAILPHEHSFTEVAILLKGRADHCSSLGVHPMKAGQAVVVRRGAWHAFQNPCGLVLYNCYVAHDIMSHELAGFENNSAVARLLSPLRYDLKAGNVLETPLSRETFLACWKILDTIYQLARPYADLGGRFPAYRPRYKLGDEPRSEAIAQIRLMAQLLILVEHLVVSLPPDEEGETAVLRHHDAVRETVRLFSEHLAHAWTLEELADTLHFNRSYLVRLFKKVTGMPPLAYLFHLRAEEAAKLLVITNRSVGDIGAEVGWPDAAYFAARFKAHFGVSPRAYRERFQKP